MMIDTAAVDAAGSVDLSDTGLSKHGLRFYDEGV